MGSLVIEFVEGDVTNIMNAFWEHARKAALAQGLEGEDVDRFVLAASYAAGGGILSLAKRLTGYVDMLTVAQAIDDVGDVVDPGFASN